MQTNQEWARNTPDGVYCAECTPQKWRDNTRQVFTIYPDNEVNAYPICVVCGRKHTYVALSDEGLKFELEVVGPTPGDVLLTECGPANALTEFSINEGELIGIYLPSQVKNLKDDVHKHLRKNPEATVWRVFADGNSELTNVDRVTAEQSRIYVNMKDGD